MKVRVDVIILEASSLISKNSKTKNVENPNPPVESKKRKLASFSFESNKNVLPSYFFSIKNAE